MNLSIGLDREDNGPWITEAIELSEVTACGSTREEAIRNTDRLAIEVIAGRIKQRTSSVGSERFVPCTQ